MNSNSKSKKKNSTHFQIQRLISWLVFVFFCLVTPNNFIPYYSHPFSGYILPGCTFKRKGGQVRFTPQQTQNLEQEFNNHKYLSPEDRKKLARELKLSDRQVWPLLLLQKFTNIPMKLRFIFEKVKTWFQNRRAKFRRTSVIGSSAKCDIICEITWCIHMRIVHICTKIQWINRLKQTNHSMTNLMTWNPNPIVQISNPIHQLHL